jgi:hypothetical protein
VLASATLAGIRTQQTLGLDATSSPGGALGALYAYVGARPDVWVLAIVLAGATFAAPYARRHGLWGIAVWGSGFIAAALIASGGAVGAFPLVLWVWVAAAVLALPLFRAR